MSLNDPRTRFRYFFGQHRNAVVNELESQGYKIEAPKPEPINYQILYVISKGLNKIEETMCHEADLGPVITGLQNCGYTIHAIISTKEPF